MSEMIQIGLVDDHKLFRDGFRLFIQQAISESLVVLAVSNGKQMIEQFSQGIIPDMIITDINNPVMNGFETTKWLREHFPKVKIVALTMKDDEATIMRMVKLGASGYFVKTMDVQELFSSLKAIAVEQTDQKGNLAEKYFSPINQTVSAIDSQEIDEEIINVWKDLSGKEKEFVELCCSDISYRQIAQQMGRSIGTMNFYREKVFQKLKVNTRVSLLLLVIRCNLFDVQL